LDLDEYKTKLAEIVSRTPYSACLKELFEQNTCELKDYNPLVVKPGEANLDTIKVRPQILFDSGAVFKREFPPRAFGSGLWEGHITWHYSHRVSQLRLALANFN